MLQIVTLRGVYLYRIAYLCIISSTEGATFNSCVVKSCACQLYIKRIYDMTWFNNFVVLNILW